MIAAGHRILVAGTLAVCGLHCSTYPHLVVPAFFAADAKDPNTGLTYWSEIPLDQTNKKRPLNMVVAEASFPDLAVQNPPAVPQVQQIFQKVHDNGGRVLGYVHTKFATIPRSTIDQQIKAWYDV